MLPNTALKVYLVISGGDVCMTDGGSIRSILYGIFPEGSVTGNLLRLL
jgi:hypothetical protein